MEEAIAGDRSIGASDLNERLPDLLHCVAFRLLVAECNIVDARNCESSTGGMMGRILELKTGDSRVFVEVDDLPGDERLQRASTGGKLEADFSKVAGALKDVVELIETQLQQLVRRPSEISLEMGAKLSGAADLWIVKGDAEANMVLTLKWTKSGATS